MNDRNKQSGQVDWLWLFIGFAIGLWIAVVVLLLRPDEAPAPAQPGCFHGCSACCDRPRVAALPTLWVPDGGERFYCTNRDNGWGVVMDGGYGVVMDSGSALADAGWGVVMDGGYGVVMDAGWGVVMDSSGQPGSQADIPDGVPRSPVPVDAELGAPRQTQEFACAVTRHGGGYVEYRTGRAVTVPIPSDPQFKCISEGGSARVLDSQRHRVAFDASGNAVVDIQGGPVPPTANEKTSLDHADAFLYCLVAKADSEPAIVKGDGTPP